MIRAIETVYDGYRFRSRLEARWAVFFNAMQIRYQYEIEGYDLDGTWYLPDFYLPEQGYILEIKPATSGNLNGHDWPEHAVWKIDDLGGVISLLPSFYLIMGDPWLNPEMVSTCENKRSDGTKYTTWWAWNNEAFDYNVYVDTDLYYHWCECPICHRVGLEFEGRARRLCDCFGAKPKVYNDATPRLMRAYRAARQARFEHGESPVM